MEIRFIGHATFELHDGDTRLLVDPFLAPHNPVAKVSAEDVEPTHVLLTHGHTDHTADAVAVARRTGAECLAVTELADWLEGKGIEGVHDPNLGGTVAFHWGSVRVVPAWHTNTTPDGTAIGPGAGLVVELGGQTVYHLGDTALFSDLALVPKRSPIDVALVPIGGHYTMDRHDAVEACALIGAPTVIPCHYDTFPPIATDAQAFKAEVESRTASRVEVLAPGEALEPARAGM